MCRIKVLLVMLFIWVVVPSVTYAQPDWDDVETELDELDGE
jgi:hypothetical protein